MDTTRLFYLICSLSCIQRVACKGKIKTFPKSFMFGASSSAYQTEGAWDEDGKGTSIWDVMTHMDSSPIKDHSTGDVSADSYHLYKRDIEIMADLKLNFYKFSISWSRIVPSGFADKINQAGLEYYDNLINELIKNNIQPFATMYHMDLPSNLQKLGGWTNPIIIELFEDYAKILFDKFADRVKTWITISDPEQTCQGGYGSISKAPMVNMSGIADYMCAKNILLAHAHVYHLYDDKFRHLHNGTIGIAISHVWFEPSSDTLDDFHAALDTRQFVWGQYAHPIFSTIGDYPHEVKHNIAQKSAEQGYPRSRLPELTAFEVAFIKGTADFLGVNAYTTKLAYRDASLEGMYRIPSYQDDIGAVVIKDNTWPQAASSWLQDVPWGFTKLLIDIRHQYDNPPMYITENGWSTKGALLDESRILYIRNYLGALLDAIDEGCDVRGYSYRSLVDNFEWRSGYTEKFGLYEVDFASREKTRTPRKSAFVYKEIIRSKTLDPDFEPDSFIAERIESEERYAKDVIL